MMEIKRKFGSFTPVGRSKKDPLKIVVCKCSCGYPIVIKEVDMILRKYKTCADKIEV